MDCRCQHMCNAEQTHAAPKPVTGARVKTIYPSASVLLRIQQWQDSPDRIDSTEVCGGGALPEFVRYLD